MKHILLILLFVRATTNDIIAQVTAASKTPTSQTAKNKAAQNTGTSNAVERHAGNAAVGANKTATNNSGGQVNWAAPDTVPIKKNGRHAGAAVFYLDTIPINSSKYFRIDDTRYQIYLNSVINKDSVKLVKASAADWEDFDKAHEALKISLKKNAFNNVQNYIDTANDFGELRLLTQARLPHTAKVCLRQLIFNISLVNQLLAKPLSNKEDLAVLSSVMKNIDLLIASYIAPIGTTYTFKKMQFPNVRLRVYDKEGAELSNVKCYFITNRTCRDIACMTCLPAMDPCDGRNVNAITGNADISYDCANPVLVKVGFGHYRIFVISKNRIIYTEVRDFNGNSMVPADNNEIKITLQ